MYKMKNLRLSQCANQSQPRQLIINHSSQQDLFDQLWMRNILKLPLLLDHFSVEKHASTAGACNAFFTVPMLTGRVVNRRRKMVRRIFFFVFVLFNRLMIEM
jgi:hypothetical protein